MKKNSKNNNFIEYIISEESKGLRLDQAISKEYDQYSRSLIQKWIKKEKILLNGKITKAKEILNINDKITIFPEENINPDIIIPEDIERFYIDLKNPMLVTRLALVHQRFSTNTFPTWDLAQPFRYMCHNGEINTLKGNINRMVSRQELMDSDLIDKSDLKKVFPIYQF